MATGYYLGARAGRQRYDQINRSLDKLRRSEAFEQAKTVVEEGLETVTEKARETVDQLTGDKAPDLPQADLVIPGSNGQSEPISPAGIILPTDPTSGGGYSSSR